MAKKLWIYLFVVTFLLPRAATASPRGHVRHTSRAARRMAPQTQSNVGALPGQSQTLMPDGRILLLGGEGANGPANTLALQDPANRSEERRVGKECRCRWWAWRDEKRDGV